MIKPWRSGKLDFEMENKLEESSPSSLTSRHVFRGIEYILSLTTNAAKEVITVEVEDRLTADQWRAQFDARCKCKVLIYYFIVLQIIRESFLVLVTTRP